MSEQLPAIIDRTKIIGDARAHVVCPCKRFVPKTPTPGISVPNSC